MWATDRNLKSDTLKGGATFKISTPTNAELKATTHSIVWDDYDDTTGSTNVAEISLADSNEPLSSVAASTRHEEFVASVGDRYTG